MTTGVIDLLEPIEIDQHDAKARAEAASHLDGLFALPLELATIRKTRQFVGGRAPFEIPTLGEEHPPRKCDEDRAESEHNHVWTRRIGAPASDALDARDHQQRTAVEWLGDLRYGDALARFVGDARNLRWRFGVRWFDVDIDVEF